MTHLFSAYFPHLVIGLMLLFMLVLGALSVDDAFRRARH